MQVRHRTDASSGADAQAAAVAEGDRKARLPAEAAMAAQAGRT